jgi:hypothetical protein
MVPGLPSPLPGLDLVLREGPWTPEFVACRVAGADVMARRFTFLGQSEDFAGRALPWNDPAFSVSGRSSR